MKCLLSLAMDTYSVVCLSVPLGPWSMSKPVEISGKQVALHIHVVELFEINAAMARTILLPQMVRRGAAHSSFFLVSSGCKTTLLVRLQLVTL